MSDAAGKGQSNTKLHPTFASMASNIIIVMLQSTQSILALDLSPFSAQAVWDALPSNPHTLGCYMIPTSASAMESTATYCIDNCKMQSECTTWAFQNVYETTGHSRCCLYKDAPSTSKQGPYGDFRHVFRPDQKEHFAGVIANGEPASCELGEDLYECYARRTLWLGRKIEVITNDTAWAIRSISETTSAKSCRDKCLGSIGVALCRTWTFNAKTKECQHSDKYPYIRTVDAKIDPAMRGLLEVASSSDEEIYTGIVMLEEDNKQGTRDIPCESSKSLAKCVVDDARSTKVTSSWVKQLETIEMQL